jgi:hypothetical protein
MLRGSACQSVSQLDGTFGTWAACQRPFKLDLPVCASPSENSSGERCSRCDTFGSRGGSGGSCSYVAACQQAALGWAAAGSAAAAADVCEWLRLLQGRRAWRCPSSTCSSSPSTTTCCATSTCSGWRPHTRCPPLLYLEQCGNAVQPAVMLTAIECALNSTPQTAGAGGSGGCAAAGGRLLGRGAGGPCGEIPGVGAHGHAPRRLRHHRGQAPQGAGAGPSAFREYRNIKSLCAAAVPRLCSNRPGVCC